MTKRAIDHCEYLMAHDKLHISNRAGERLVAAYREQKRAIRMARGI